MKVAIILLALVAVAAASSYHDEDEFTDHEIETMKRFLNLKAWWQKTKERARRLKEKIASGLRKAGSWFKQKFGSVKKFFQVNGKKLVNAAKNFIRNVRDKFHKGELLSFSKQTFKNILNRVSKFLNKFGIKSDFLGHLAGKDGKIAQLLKKAFASKSVKEMAKNLHAIGKDLWENGKAALKNAVSHVKKNYRTIMTRIVTTLTKTPTKECHPTVNKVLGEFGTNPKSITSHVRGAICNLAEFIKDEAVEKIKEAAKSG